MYWGLCLRRLRRMTAVWRTPGPFVGRGLVHGLLVGLALFALGAALDVEPASAKAPGTRHCYGNVCHHVLTVEATARLIGKVQLVQTSFYDHPSVDRFNTGHYTSNGEVFDAASPGRVSSSDLPDGTELLIRNPTNGRASHVRVNDFGPFKSDRKLDVTRRVAEDLGFKNKGLAVLEVYVITAPLPEDRLYRRNRHVLDPGGHLGVVAEAELAPRIKALIEGRTRRTAPRVSFAADQAVTVLADVGRANLTSVGAYQVALPAARSLPAPEAMRERHAPVAVVALPEPVRGRLIAASTPAWSEVTSPAPMRVAVHEQSYTVLDHVRMAFSAWSQRHGQTSVVLAALAITALGFGMAGQALARSRDAGARVAMSRSNSTDDDLSADLQSVEASLGAGKPMPAYDGAFIGEDIVIVGRVVTHSSLVLAGEIRGSIVADRVDILSGGRVAGTVVARIVTVAGEVDGDVQADDVRVGAAGHVTGNIRASILVIAPGASVEGSVSSGRLRDGSTPLIGRVRKRREVIVFPGANNRGSRLADWTPAERPLAATAVRR